MARDKLFFSGVETKTLLKCLPIEAIKQKNLYERETFAES